MIKIKSVYIFLKHSTNRHLSYTKVSNILGYRVSKIWIKTNKCIKFINNIEYYD